MFISVFGAFELISYFLMALGRKCPVSFANMIDLYHRINPVQVSSQSVKNCSRTDHSTRFHFSMLLFCGCGSLAIWDGDPLFFLPWSADELFGVVTCWKGQYIPKRPLRSDRWCQIFRFPLSSSSNLMFCWYVVIFVTANHPCHVWKQLFWVQPRSRIINGPECYHLGATASGTQLIPASYVTIGRNFGMWPRG